MVAKISVQKLRQKQNACMFSKICPMMHITRYKVGWGTASWNGAGRKNGEVAINSVIYLIYYTKVNLLVLSLFYDYVRC